MRELYILIVAYLSTTVVIFMTAGLLKLSTYLMGYSFGYWYIFGAVLGLYTVVTMIKISITGRTR